MRIVVLGEDSFTAVVLESLLNEGHEIIHVFCPEYDNNFHAVLARICKFRGIPFDRVKNFNSKQFIDRLRRFQNTLDLIAICHFQKLISNAIIEIPKFGCLNLHPSLLPDYRGMAPQHWPIINGDKRTGVTVHFVDEGIDTGDIVVQEKIDISNNDYVSDVQMKMKKVYASIFVDAIEKLKEKQLHKVQKHIPGSYYGKLRLEDCQIHEDMDVEKAHNLIRGVSYPYFGARFGKYILWRAKIKDKRPNKRTEFEIKSGHEGILYLKKGTLLITRFGKEVNEKI